MHRNHLVTAQKKTGHQRNCLRSTLYNPKKPNENFLHPDVCREGPFSQIFLVRLLSYFFLLSFASFIDLMHPSFIN